MKKGFGLILKVLLLSIILLVCMIAFSEVGAQHSAAASGNAILPLFGYCILTAAVLALFIMHSNLLGFRLVLVCFVITWGTQYFMTQIETLYFDSAVKMALTEIVRNVIFGGLYTAVFCFLAVLILGKFKKVTHIEPEGQKNNWPIKTFIRNIIALSLIYVVIYFVFGYFVAWQFADVRLFYSKSTQIVNFFAHMSNQFQQDPILPLFQLFRGIMWSFLAILILQSLRTKNHMAFYLIPGFIFSVLITTMLIFPNAYMPLSVRIGHSFELSTSMMTFGIVSSFVFRKQFTADDHT
jgi:hypothetical protein